MPPGVTLERTETKGEMETQSNAGESDLIRLIQESRAGTEESLNKICARLRPTLIQQCQGRFQGRLQSKSTESDLVQEALLSVSQNFTSFRGQTVDEFYAWAARILENKSIEFQRKFLTVGKRDITREIPIVGENSSAFGPALEAGAVSPLDRLVSAEDAVQVRRLIAQLPEHYRTVIRLRHLDELSFPQIATELGWTEPSVKNIYVRAMEHLKQRMNSGSKSR